MRSLTVTSLFVVFLFIGIATAQEDLDRFKPREPLPVAGPEAAREPEEMPSAPIPSADPGAPGLALRGMVFVEHSSAIREDGLEEIEGVATTGVPFLQERDFVSRMERYLGQPISLDLVNVIAEDVALYYREHDHPVVSVVAPDQDITGGVVQFLVIEGRIGEVRVEGNRWFNDSLFRTRAKPGDPIIMSRLEADTAFYGRNPFRSVVAELSPGTDPGETDITLMVEDKIPLRLYTGYENSGVETSGQDRLFAGVNYGNLFGLGQEISYQFTSSTDFEQLLAHSATWNMPLPWMHLLQFSGVYSESNPELGDGLDLTGESWQTGVRYIVPLPKLGKLNHEVALGYDFKFTNNNLIFGGVEVFDTPVEISQFSLAYSASLPDRLGRTAASAAGYWSPGGMSSHNDDEDFEAARAGSEADYFYATLSLDRITRLPANLTWAFSASGQLSDGNLQATEQFIIGGYSTVRGYDELAVSGDSGFLMRNEIYSPPISVLELVRLNEKVNDRLQFLAFYDLGAAGIADPLPGEDDEVTLQSAGLGLRWQIASNVSVRFDYGWQLEDIGLEDSGRGHIGVTVSY